MCDFHVLPSEPAAHASGMACKVWLVSSLLLNCSDEDHDQKRLGQERVSFHFTACSLSFRGAGAGTQADAMRSPACSVTHESSMYFLIPPWTTCPGRALPSVSWVLLYQPQSRKCPHSLAYSQPAGGTAFKSAQWRHCLQASPMKAFSQIRFFPDDCSLCQVDNNQPGTGGKTEIYCHCPPHCQIGGECALPLTASPRAHSTAI